MKKIFDEFTNLPVSRERKRQLRKAKAGLYIHANCKRKPWRKSHNWCQVHAIAYREAQRRRLSCARRNTNSASYQ